MEICIFHQFYIARLTRGLGNPKIQLSVVGYSVRARMRLRWHADMQRPVLIIGSQRKRLHPHEPLPPLYRVIEKIEVNDRERFLEHGPISSHVGGGAVAPLPVFRGVHGCLSVALRRFRVSSLMMSPPGTMREPCPAINCQARPHPKCPRRMCIRNNSRI